MARRPGRGSRAETARAYWRELRKFAERTGLPPGLARRDERFRSAYAFGGKAPTKRELRDMERAARKAVKPRGGPAGGSTPTKRSEGPQRPPRGASGRPPSRSKGFTSGGRERALRTYWDFVNAYAGANRMPPSRARTDPGFREAYQRYREGLAAEAKARAERDDAAFEAAKKKQLDALVGLGMISPEERNAKAASPKAMKLGKAGRGDPDEAALAEAERQEREFHEGESDDETE